MRSPARVACLALVCVTIFAGGVRADDAGITLGFEADETGDFEADRGSSIPHEILTRDRGAIRQTALPTERLDRQAAEAPPTIPQPDFAPSSPDHVFQPQQPPVFPPSPPIRSDLVSEWEAARDGFAMSNVDLTLTTSLPPWYGPPPPTVSVGFGYTNIDAPAAIGLPRDLYDLSLAIGWMRRLSDQWMLRLNAGAAIATDFENTSGDMWQFRGGAFGLYQSSRQWQWAVGVLATGRQDIPVLPGAGAVWTPNPRTRVDLIMPRPRVSCLAVGDETRQHWIYAGGAIDGGTWAFQRANGTDDLASYSEWRLSLGWDSRTPGMFGQPGPGLAWEAEVAYVLGRKFEFENGDPDFEPGHTVMLRARLRY